LGGGAACFWGNVNNKENGSSDMFCTFTFEEEKKPSEK
jgi:hypothetical protein